MNPNTQDSRGGGSYSYDPRPQRFASYRGVSILASQRFEFELVFDIDIEGAARVGKSPQVRIDKPSDRQA